MKPLSRPCGKCGKPHWGKCDADPPPIEEVKAALKKIVTPATIHVREPATASNPKPPEIRQAIRHGLETGEPITGPIAKRMSDAFDEAFTETLAARCRANGLTIWQAAEKYLVSLDKARARLGRHRKGKE